MKTIHILLLVFISLSTWAQETLKVGKKEFFVKEEGFDEAWGMLDEAMFMMEEHTREAREIALGSFLKAAIYNPNCAPLNYNIAQAYKANKQEKQALEFFEKAFKANPDMVPDMKLQMAVLLHLNSRFAEARTAYFTYLQSLSASEQNKAKAMIDKRVQECRYGEIYAQNPQRVIIRNLGPEVNSAYNDHSPVITADNTVMYFTSRRPTTANDKRDTDGGYFEDIYRTEFKDGKWQDAVPAGQQINTPDHDATIGLAPDGQTMFVYKAKNKGDIFETRLVGTDWEKTRPLKGDINTSGRESSACISYDGKELFIVSDREGTLGGTDIFVCHQDEKGRWVNPQNIGNVINTPYNEEQIFIMPDGQTLYFCSQGHSSIGGFDIFRTTRDAQGNWSEPQNLGTPINTPGDDVFYVAAANGRYAYYASETEGGIGGSDIYKIQYLSAANPLVMERDENLIACISEPQSQTPEVKPMEIKTIRLTILKGIVCDSISRKPVDADIAIVDNDRNQLIFSSKANSSTGEYLVALPSGRNYGIAVSKDGFMFHSENFDIPQAQNYTEITKTIPLLNIKTGSKIILKNIFFETGSARLTPASQAEIDRVTAFLQHYPQIRIRINGHTDNVGADAANLNLSQQRAQSVVNALIDKTIPTIRLEAKGFGETTPIAPNDTPENRQLNRRVEFEVID